MSLSYANNNEVKIIGGRELSGKVKVSGYKHALTVIIAASVISNNKETVLYNVPNTYETQVLIKILERLGANVSFSENMMKLKLGEMQGIAVPEELSRQIHGSVYLIPAMLARFGEVFFGGAGGDMIGGKTGKEARSIEHIISILERFGAKFEMTKRGVHGVCKKFKAQEIDINDYSEDKSTNSGPFVSGATKTAILAASVAQGRSIIKNPWDKDAALELIEFIRNCGCRVEIHKGYWIIEGGIGRGRVFHDLVSDTTEILTYVACSTFLRNPILITNLNGSKARKFLAPELETLDKMGVGFKWKNKEVKINPPEILKPVDIVATSRGLNTDSQPFFTLMLTTADGPSFVSDHVWRQRFAYVKYLSQLGAKLKNQGRAIQITPKKPFITKTVIEASDTRSAAVAVLAALAVKGPTKVRGILHIDRGYEKFIEKIQGLGAHVYNY